MAYQSDIKKALNERLAEYITAFPVDVAWEASSYEPTEGTLYLTQTFLPATPVQRELQGASTKDRFTGIYQINIVNKKGTGTTSMETHEEQLQAYFGRGTLITRTTTNGEEVPVEILKYYSGQVNDTNEPWVFIPVFVQWRSDIWVGTP